jgi:fibronectin type 3 domain-containing protein
MSINDSILWTKAALRALLGLAVVCVVGFVSAKGAIAQEVVAIAAGGPAQSNSSGGDYPFVADEDFSGGGDNQVSGAPINLTQPGANAAPMAVYQHARAGIFTYTIPGLIAGTQYSVLLHFAETYFTAAGQREFDVAINGTSVLTNLDIYATVGANAALERTFTATANSSGDIVIAFTDGAANQPVVSGMEVRDLSTTCSTAASAPAGLTASASSSSAIGLSWTAVTPPTNCTISAYNVYGSKTSGFTPSSSTLLGSPTGTTFTNTGLAASTTYYYVVEAIDAEGASAPSSQASAETSAAPCAAVPSAPAGFTATATSSSSIGLSWTAVTPPANCTVSSYRVYGSTTSGFTPSASNLLSSPTGTTYSNTGLSPSTTYYYVVEAVDAEGTSAASSQQSATTQAVTSGTEIVAIAAGGPAESNSSGGDVSFVADEDFSGGGDNAATSATINLTQPGVNAAPMAVYQHGRSGAFTYTIPGLTAGAQYTVLLHFAETYFTAAGDREFNVAINGTSVLTNLDIYATVGANAALLETFTATANSSGDIVIAFTLGAANQPLLMGIEVRSSSGSGGSCSTVPSAPTGLTATASSSSSIGLSWSAVTPPADCTITTYNVYRSTTSRFTPSSGNLITSTSGTTYSNTGLTASTTYYYVVEAVDAEGTSTASSQAFATTQSSGSSSTEIVAIAAGGPAQSNINGGDDSFVADEYYNGGADNGAVTAAINLSQPGANAAPMGVYQNGRVGISTYTIPGLAAGAQYSVLLHFAETYFTAAGDRQFNVAINGATVLTNLDVYATVGSDAALLETFPATANSSGQIVISLTGGAENAPLIMGIEVRGAPSACTLVPSGTPTAVMAAASSPSIIGLNWTPVAAPPNCAITYSVYGSTVSGFTPSSSTLLATGLTGTSYSNTGLKPSTTYYYVIVAVDGAGTSAGSTQTSAETNSATSCASVPEAAPTGLAVTPSTSTALGVSWNAVMPPAYCTTITYNLYGSTVSGFTPSVSNEIAVGLTGTKFFNTGLLPSSTYYYIVQAADVDGVSTEYSAQESATTLVPPTVLTAAASSANEIDLSFPASAAAAPVQYLIFRSTSPTFTPSSANQVGTTKSNYYNDVVLAASTTYYYQVEASNPAGVSAPTGPVSATTLPLGESTPFWGPGNIPAAPVGDVMTFAFVNRTNGQYPDNQVWWSTTINGVTTTNTIAAQPYFEMPANSSGRMEFYLGPQGTSSPYSDFIEFTIGPTSFNGDTTRVDQFGLKLAMQLTCGDGTDIAVGENSATFAESRPSTFQRYVTQVQAPFQTLGQTDAPYAILSPGAGGFDTGGPYDTYYNAYIAQIWASNNLTIPIAGDNGDGLGANPDLSAAIYRHTAAPGTFNPNGTLISESMWGNPNLFYQTAPASYYAQWFHANAINGQQYAFPYDDAGGYSSDVGCSNPQSLVVAVGW